MKKSLLKLAGAVLLALSAASLTQADPIAGRIDVDQFGSTALVDFTNQTVTFNPGTANSNVGFATGDFASLLGTSATYLSFSYASSSTPETIWTINPTTYFVLNTFTYLSQTTTPSGENVGLSLWGSGTIYLTGYDPTPGLWTFSSSTTEDHVRFNFSSTNNTEVPDGGTTAMLVGLGLVGMGFIARRRK